MSGSVSVPGVPATLGAWQREIERKIEILETTSRLYNSAIREGTLRIQDSSGNPMVTLGKLDDGTYGLLVQKADGNTVMRISSDGHLLPSQPLPIIGNGLVSGLTSGFRPGTAAVSPTWGEIWRADFVAQGTNVSYDMTVFPNGGAMDWQIQVQELPQPLVTAVGPTNETSNIQRAGNFAIPAAALVSGTDPVGKTITVRWFARRTSGAPVTVDISMNAVPFCYNP